MPSSLAVTDLLSAKYKVQRIQQGKQVISHVKGRFQAVVNGRCMISFAGDVVLTFDWMAVGQSDEHGIEFSVKPREDFEPLLHGASLVDGCGLPLSWQEQSSSLLALVGKIDWNEAVKESVAKTCLVGADF